MIQGNVRGGPNITVALPSNLISEALAECLSDVEVDIAGVPTLPELLSTMEKTPELNYERL